MERAKREDIVGGLQADILRLEGFRPASNASMDLGLEFMKESFPNGSFPLGSVHEFISEHGAATSGFIAGLLSALTAENGTAMWVSPLRTIFPPALKSFGIQPDRIIFVDLQKERDVLWSMEEALKCSALTAVVGEMHDLEFIASRRLQLAVEQSQVTGFIIRHKVRKLNPTACVSRWKISSMPSYPVDDVPGVGFPQWRVELLRMRNGKPGTWDIRWINGRFAPSFKQSFVFLEQKLKAG